MDNVVAEPLSYASPQRRAGRFRCVWAFVPFTIGMVVGGGASVLVCAIIHQPVEQDAVIITWWMAAFVATGLEVVYVIAALSISALILAPTARRWPLTALLGALLTLLAFGGAGVAEEASGTRWNLLGLIALASLVAALIFPFLLVRCRQTSARHPLPRLERPSWVIGLFIGAVLSLSVVGAAMHQLNQLATERGCIDIAIWVRITHPAGVAQNLVLPPSLASNSADGTADAVTLADGRIVLLVKKMIGWKGNWSGVIYCTGPVMPTEIGRDAYGRPMLLFKGLSDHFILNQIDSRHFKASFDLG